MPDTGFCETWFSNYTSRTPWDAIIYPCYRNCFRHTKFSFAHKYSRGCWLLGIGLMCLAHENDVNWALLYLLNSNPNRNNHKQHRVYGAKMYTYTWTLICNDLTNRQIVKFMTTGNRIGLYNELIAPNFNYCNYCNVWHFCNNKKYLLDGDESYMSITLRSVTNDYESSCHVLFVKVSCQSILSPSL